MIHSQEKLALIFPLVKGISAQAHGQAVDLLKAKIAAQLSHNKAVGEFGPGLPGAKKEGDKSMGIIPDFETWRQLDPVRMVVVFRTQSTM